MRVLDAQTALTEVPPLSQSTLDLEKPTILKNRDIVCNGLLRCKTWQPAWQQATFPHVLLQASAVVKLTPWPHSKTDVSLNVFMKLYTYISTSLLYIKPTESVVHREHEGIRRTADVIAVQ